MPDPEQEDWEEWFANRPRGILSPKERKHLMGLLDEDPREDADAIRQREYRIRQHIRQSFIDFQLLSNAITPGIGEMFADVFSKEDTPEDDFPLEEGVASVFEFLFLVLGNPDKGGYSPFRHLLSTGVESALVRHYTGRGLSVNPDVLFRFKTGEHVPIEDVERVFGGDDYILAEELETLLWSGKIAQERGEGHRDDQMNVIEKVVKESGTEKLNEWVDEAQARRKEDAVEIDDSYFEFTDDDLSE